MVLGHVVKNRHSRRYSGDFRRIARGVVTTASRAVSEPMASERNPSLRDRSGTDINGTAIEHDVAETIHAGTDHVARCPECGREALWSEREHLTHRDECPYRLLEARAEATDGSE